MSLVLRLRESPGERIAVDGALSPERLLGAADPASLPLADGLSVGDLFDVAEESGEVVSVSGDLSRLDGVGAGMASGWLRVSGTCGARCGAGMRGGQITVQGDVGARAGAAMDGGRLVVGGSAGARLGAAWPGARSGMSHGEIVVHGDAGEEAGAGLRRGLIVIAGRAGPGAGTRMLAGTVIALGGFAGLAGELGPGNKRGSLVSGVACEVGPGYRFAAAYRPPALGLQLRRVRALGLEVPEALLAGVWERHCGDLAELGKGEILTPSETEPA